MVERNVEFHWTVDGAGEATTDVESFNRELVNTARRAVTADEAMKEFGGKATQVGGALGQIGGQLSQINPRLGSFVSGIGQAASAIGAMSVAAGPLGLAMGALAAAMAIASAASVAFADDTNTAAHAANEARQSIEQLAEAYRHAAHESELLRGGAGIRETTESLHEAEDAAAQLLIQIRRVRQEEARTGSSQYVAGSIDAPNTLMTGAAVIQDSPRVAALVRQREAALRRAERLRAAQETAAGDIETQEGYGAFLAGAGGRSSGGGGVEVRQARHAAREISAIKSDLEDELAGYDQDAKTRAHDRWQFEIDEAQRAKDKIAELEEREKDKAHEASELRLEMLDREKEKTAEAFQEISDDAEGVLKPVVGGLVSALSAVVAGTESADEAFQGMLASFLEMISQQAALEAAKEFAAAIASFASENYGEGALHVAAGVAYTAVAVAAGAASIAVAPPAASPAAPQAGAGESSGGETTIYVNYNAGVYVHGGRAEIGRELDQLVGEGRRRYGAAA